MVRIERRILTSADGGSLAARFLSRVLGRFHWSVNSLNVTVRSRFGSRLHLRSQGFLMSRVNEQWWQAETNCGSLYPIRCVAVQPSNGNPYDILLECTPHSRPIKCRANGWLLECGMLARCQRIRITHAVPTLRRSNFAASCYFQAV